MIVVHYIPDIDQRSSGTATYMRMVVAALAHRVELHVFTHRSAHQLDMPGSKVHYLPPFSLWGWQKMVVRQLVALHPDVVHVNCCWMPACAAFQRAAQMLHIPVALTTHGMLEPWIMARHYYTRKWPALRLYQAAALTRADMLVATAEREASHLRTLAYNGRVCVIHTGIEIGSIQIKASWVKRRTILFLGRIHQVKGIWCLLDALRMARAHMDGYRMIIAGEGEQRDIDHLHNCIQQWHLGDMAHYVGGKYGDDKWQLLRQADFLVQPSYTENFGLSIAEALAAGTPVITTNGTPWKDLDAQYCGTCIATGEDALAQALISFVGLSASELEAMGRNGRQLIEARYSAQAMGQRMIELYQNLADCHR